MSKIFSKVVEKSRHLWESDNDFILKKKEFTLFDIHNYYIL